MQTHTPPPPSFPTIPAAPEPTAPESPPSPPEPPPPDSAPPNQLGGGGFGPSSDPTRSGALWVGATGVSLLLAAAAVLTAVRWDEIGQSAKLGGLVAITLAMLALGRRLKSTIPMTASAIFHLGAGLVPFDMAAIATLAGWSWKRTLLLTALTAAGSWYGFARVERSKVLEWAGHLAVVLAAAGVAAVSGASAPLVLAVVAAGALIARESTMATIWAIAAGFATMGALIEWPVRIADAATDLGFTSADRWQLAAAGAIACVVTIVNATRARHLELAWTAVALTVSNLIVGYELFSTGTANTYLYLGLVFVAVELLALATRNDDLWKPVTTVIGGVGEIGAAMATVSIGFYALFGDLLTSSRDGREFTIAAVLLALGWLTADRRRLIEPTDWLAGLVLGANWVPTTFLLPAAVLGGVVSVTDAPGIIALTLLALGAWMIGTRRLLGSHLGSLLAVGAALAVGGSPASVVILTGVGAALLMTSAARMRAKEAECRVAVQPIEGAADDDLPFKLGSVALAAFAAIFWLTTSGGIVDVVGHSWLMPILVAGFWGLSWLIELPERRALSTAAGWVGRGAALLTLGALAEVDPLAGLAAVSLIVAAAGLDYWRSASRPSLAISAAVAALAGIPLAELVGVDLASGGVAMTMAGFVAIGVMLAMPKEWELPLGTFAASLSVVGLALAAAGPATLALAVMTVGSTIALLGVALRKMAVVTVGGVVVAVGFWLQLTLWDVTWLEPYLAFPGIAALVVGYHAMRQGANSWVAFAPTILVFAGVAELDRITGGSGWHGVIAGAVGVAAVIAGGYRRLAGPLITGTVVLATVVGYESLGPAALVPTWGWLAIGGTVLLGSAVAMERADTSPIETGQRLRQVIESQYR